MPVELRDLNLDQPGCRHAQVQLNSPCVVLQRHGVPNSCDAPVLSKLLALSGICGKSPPMHRTQPLQRLMFDRTMRHSVQPLQDSAKQALELTDLAVAQQLQKEEDSSPKSVLDHSASSSAHGLASMQVPGLQLSACKEVFGPTYAIKDNAE